MVCSLPDGRRFAAGIKGNKEFCRKLLKSDPKPWLVTVRYQNLTPDGVPRFGVAFDFHYGDGGRRD